MQYSKKDYESSREIFLEDKLLFKDRNEFNNVVQNFILSQQNLLIINFENTIFLDTSGLGCLLIALQNITDANKNLVLKNPKNKVKESIHMLNLDKIFNVENYVQ